MATSLSSRTAETLKGFNENETLFWSRDFDLCSLFQAATGVPPEEGCPKTPQAGQAAPPGCSKGCCLCSPRRLAPSWDAPSP